MLALTASEGTRQVENEQRRNWFALQRRNVTAGALFAASGVQAGPFISPPADE
jgi:hypothetical protein